MNENNEEKQAEQTQSAKKKKTFGKLTSSKFLEIFIIVVVCVVALLIFANQAELFSIQGTVQNANPGHLQKVPDTNQVFFSVLLKELFQTEQKNDVYKIKQRSAFGASLLLLKLMMNTDISPAPESAYQSVCQGSSAFEQPPRGRLPSERRSAFLSARPCAEQGSVQKVPGSQSSCP